MSNWIDDGHGNKWHRCKLGPDCGLKVIEAGRAKCWCQDQEASRCEVQAAREQIAKLEDDNERMRELVSTLGAPNHVGVPVEQWKALRDDKKRLDWLGSHQGIIEHWEGDWYCEGQMFTTIRAAIDAAMETKL